MWEIARYLHILAMAFFVGGQLVVIAAVVPVERHTHLIWLKRRILPIGILIGSLTIVWLGLELAH